jgi:hypothetical protein
MYIRAFTAAGGDYICNTYYMSRYGISMIMMGTTTLLLQEQLVSFLTAINFTLLPGCAIIATPPIIVNTWWIRPSSHVTISNTCTITTTRWDDIADASPVRGVVEISSTFNCIRTSFHSTNATATAASVVTMTTAFF